MAIRGHPRSLPRIATERVMAIRGESHLPADNSMVDRGALRNPMVKQCYSAVLSTDTHCQLLDCLSAEILVAVRGMPHDLPRTNTTIIDHGCPRKVPQHCSWSSMDNINNVSRRNTSGNVAATVTGIPGPSRTNRRQPRVSTDSHGPSRTNKSVKLLENLRSTTPHGHNKLQ